MRVQDNPLPLQLGGCDLLAKNGWNPDTSHHEESHPTRMCPYPTPQLSGCCCNCLQPFLYFCDSHSPRSFLSLENIYVLEIEFLFLKMIPYFYHPIDNLWVVATTVITQYFATWLIYSLKNERETMKRFWSLAYCVKLYVFICSWECQDMISLNRSTC